jgi:predicted metal-dependent hydrolase
MLTPAEVQDYVIVHELAHRKEMNHSSKFWAVVGEIMPDYKTTVRWLKEHGGEIINSVQQF